MQLNRIFNFNFLMYIRNQALDKQKTIHNDYTLYTQILDIMNESVIIMSGCENNL